MRQTLGIVSHIHMLGSISMCMTSTYHYIWYNRRSPFISTMRYLSYTSVSSDDEKPTLVIKENTAAIAPAPSPDARRAQFGSAENRRKVRFGPSTLIQSDFCHGYLEFAKGEGLELSLPVVKLDLLRYWDGRPVWFVCCERRKDGKPGPGDSIFCVGFEIMVDT